MKIMSAIAVGMMAASVAAAQAEGDAKLFDQLDVNGDGQISAYEAEANMQVLERFNQLDSNGDGRLSREEFAAFEKQEE